MKLPKRRFRKHFANCPSCFRCPDKKACDLDFNTKLNEMIKNGIIQKK